MVPQDKIIEFFCPADDFCAALESEIKKHRPGDGSHKRNRGFTTRFSSYSIL